MKDVTTKIELYGNRNEIQELKNFAISNDTFNFQKIYPIPSLKELEEMNSDKENWTMYNWGDIEESEVDVTENVIYSYSDFLPPYLICEKLAELFPKVKIVMFGADVDHGNYHTAVFEKGTEIFSVNSEFF